MSQWQTIKKHPGLRRYLPTGVYFIHQQIGGRRLRQSLETTQLLVACRKRDQLLAFHREAPAQASEWSFAELCDFQRQRLPSKGNKPRTLQYNLACLTLVKTSWSEPDRPVHTITPLDCERWALALRQKYSPSRFNGALWQLRAVFALAIKVGARLDDPSREVKAAPVPIQKPGLWLPSDAEFEALVATVRQQRCGLREERADYILFLRWTGLRVNEAAQLRKTDVDLAHDQINVPGNITKNGRPRSVPIFVSIRAIVQRWLTEELPPGRSADRLCPVWNLKSCLKSACAKLKFPVRLSHHDFRHLFITYWMEHGVPPHHIAGWVGHLDNGRLILTTYTSVRNPVENDLIRRLNADLEKTAGKNVIPVQDWRRCAGQSSV